MDQGEAAVWAAAVTGAVGVVAAFCAYGAGRAQANGVRDGVRLQLSGERATAIWTAERDAYAAYLAAIDHFRLSVIHAIGRLEGHYVHGNVSEQEASAASVAVRERYTQVLSSQATLRLSVRTEDVDQAVELTAMAEHLLDAFVAYGDSFVGGQSDEAFINVDHLEGRLNRAIKAWSERVRQHLADGARRSTR